MSSAISAAPATDSAARQALLTGLARGLGLLADHVLPHAGAAVELSELAARAEELAAEAWTQSAARTPNPAAAQALAAAFTTFIAEAAELSRRAAHSAAATREVGATMAGHASALAALATQKAPPDIATLRVALRPVVASLETLPARLAENRAMADDVAKLGAKATELGTLATAPRAFSRPASTVALEIYRNLRSLGDEAAALADTMRGDVAQMRTAFSGIAGQAGRLAAAGQPATATRAAPPAASAETRLGKVMAQGRSIEWGTATRRS